jgi:hypothetical protein
MHISASEVCDIAKNLGGKYVYSDAVFVSARVND